MAPPAAGAERQRLREHLAAAQMPVTASIESHLTTRDLRDVQPGDIVLLGVPASRPVNVHVGRTLCFKGRRPVGHEHVRRPR